MMGYLTPLMLLVLVHTATANTMSKAHYAIYFSSYTILIYVAQHFGEHALL